MATKFFNLDTDSTFAANSDFLIPSQKAIKTELDKKVGVRIDEGSDILIFTI